MFNVAICDDDKNFIQYVEDIIKELGYAEDVKFFEYLSGEEFLFDIDERGDLDLVVLDIQMGETDGNQVSVELRKRYKSTTLVFCSGYFKPSPENIKVSPFRFLLKEYSRERMVSEFKEIFEYLMNNKDEPSIVCRGERSQVQVYANEIMYIQICITKISTFLILCDLAVCLATLYVSFSLVFALMRYLQGKVFLIRFYSPTTLSSSRAEFRLPSRLACA